VKEIVILGFISIATLIIVILSSPKDNINDFVRNQRFTDPDLGIVRLYRKNGEFICSGVTIRKNRILTAAHCVSSIGEQLEVRKSNNEDIGTKATVLNFNAAQDLAVLNGDFSNFNTILVLNSAYTLDLLFSPAQKINCGFPWGGRIICLNSAVKGFYAFTIAVSAPLWPGMSGGAFIAIEDENAILLGVNKSVGKDSSYISPLIEPEAALGTALNESVNK
jgi:S1-C subfamily serine protease